MIRLNAFAAAYRLYDLFVKHTHVISVKHIHICYYNNIYIYIYVIFFSFFFLYINPEI